MSNSRDERKRAQTGADRTRTALAAYTRNITLSGYIRVRAHAVGRGAAGHRASKLRAGDR